MATFQEVIERAMKSGNIKMLSINQNMLQVAMPSKRKSAFLKTAVTEELAQGLLHRKRVAFILHIDGDEMNAIAAEIDAETENESA